MMNQSIEFIVLGVLSLLLTLLIIPFIKRIALKIDLVDCPNYRKVHSSSIPLVGGISIAIVTFLLLLISGDGIDMLINFSSILGSVFVLLVVGVIDDKNDLPALYKLIIQILLAFVIAHSGTRINSLHGLFGITDLAIELQYLLTILVITGVVNAFNLMDGVDGLIGGLSLLGFTFLLITALHLNNYLLAKLSAIFIGAVIGFLRFNLSRKKIFMGDAGSLFLGLILVSLAISLGEHNITRRPTNFPYGFFLLVTFFCIPVLDSIRVYLGRMKAGKSPFSADKSHLHHLLLNAGLTHKKITIFITLFLVVLFFIGLLLASFFSTTTLILVYVFIFIVVVRVLLLINELYYWLKKF